MNALRKYGSGFLRVKKIESNLSEVSEKASIKSGEKYSSKEDEDGDSYEKPECSLNPSGILLFFFLEALYIDVCLFKLSLIFVVHS